MLTLRRPRLCFSASPLWPARGAWLGMRPYPHEVEVRRQSWLRWRGSCILFLVWLIYLCTRGISVHQRQCRGVGTAVEYVLGGVLPPAFWINFLRCQDPVASRHALYLFVFFIHICIMLRSLFNAWHDACLQYLLVVARRFAMMGLVAAFHGIMFWQVSICLWSAALLPAMLLYQYRCMCELAYAQVAMAASSHTDLETTSLVGCLLVLVLSGVVHGRELSRQVISESLRQKHAQFIQERQAYDSIVNTHSWKMMSSWRRSNDLAGFRWLLLHQERVGTLRMPLRAEVVIRELLGRNLTGKDDLGDVSSWASRSLASRPDALREFRIKLWWDSIVDD